MQAHFHHTTQTPNPIWVNPHISMGRIPNKEAIYGE